MKRLLPGAESWELQASSCPQRPQAAGNARAGLERRISDSASFLRPASMERLVLFYLSKIAKKSGGAAKTVSGGRTACRKDLTGALHRRRQRGIGLHAGGLVDDGDGGLRAVRMLGALLYAAQLSALRSGPIRPPAARPVLRHRFVLVLARSAIRVARRTGWVRRIAPGGCGPVCPPPYFGPPVNRCAVVPAASLLRSERSGRSLSLTGSVESSSGFRWNWPLASVPRRVVTELPSVRRPLVLLCRLGGKNSPKGRRRRRMR